MNGDFIFKESFITFIDDKLIPKLKHLWKSKGCIITRVHMPTPLFIDVTNPIIKEEILKNPWMIFTPIGFKCIDCGKERRFYESFYS